MGVLSMSSSEKVAEAMRRSLPLLPEAARQQVMALLSPGSVALISGTLVVWAGSHFFGIGEVVDVVLLAVGVALTGAAALSGAKELMDFATEAMRARTDADLDRSARHFANAVSILGVAVVSALLLRRSVKDAAGRGVPGLRGFPSVAPPGSRPTIVRPATLPSGMLGETDWWGNIAVIRNQSLTEQRVTLYHEWVHRWLTPRFGPLRELRVRLRASGYWRSALLRYLEEALAEGYAQLRVCGLGEVVSAIRFPIQGGYVTVSQLASEGVAIGNILVGGQFFQVYVTEGSWLDQAEH